MRKKAGAMLRMLIKLFGSKGLVIFFRMQEFIIKPINILYI